MGHLIVLPQEARAEKERRRARSGMWAVRLTMLAMLAALGFALAVGLRLVGG